MHINCLALKYFGLSGTCIGKVFSRKCHLRGNYPILFFLTTNDTDICANLSIKPVKAIFREIVFDGRTQRLPGCHIPSMYIPRPPASRWWHGAEATYSGKILAIIALLRCVVLQGPSETSSRLLKIL